MNYIIVGLLLLLSSGAFGENLDKLLQQARLNNPQAQYEVASYYLLRKDDDTQNSKLALYWFETAADNGNTDAQTYLAQEYRQGLITKKNDQLAVYWLTVLALKGQDSATLELARYFQSHPNNHINFTEIWYRIAANSSPEGEQEYSKYLQTKFNQKREEQLSDTQQLESTFTLLSDNQTSNHESDINHITANKISSDWFFWLLSLIPLACVFLVINLLKKIRKLKHQIKYHSLSVDQDRSAQQAQIQKQKQQINLLFNELKRSKVNTEQQTIDQACALFGYTPSSIPDKHQIKVRYKQLSKIYHPDMKGSEEEMKRLNQALKIILNKFHLKI